MNNLNNPIFILGAHKSGTTLLRNLLDGHSELFVIPMEPHPFQMLNKWLLYELRSTSPKNISYNQAKKNLLKLILHLSKTKDQKGGGIVSDKWDLKIFEKELFSQNVENLKEFIEQYVQAIHYSIFKTKPSAELRFVEKSVTNTEYAIELYKYFPNSKFIHVVRNPYANLVSIRKYKSKSKLPFLKAAINTLVNSHYFLHRNREIIDNYMIIKYEDLVENLDKSMQHVSEFLQIKNEEILFKPTSLAEPWLGNSVYDKKSFGVYNASLEKWKTEIADIEIYLINKFMNYFLSEFNYSSIDCRKNIFWPNGKESIKTYILNRILIAFDQKK